MSDERKTAITADSGFGTTHPLPEGSRLVVPESAALAALRAQLDGATQQMSLASESARKMEAAWREECKETDALRAREATLAAEVERLRDVVLRLWDEETLSEGQATVALGVERVEARGMLHDYRAAQPVCGREVTTWRCGRAAGHTGACLRPADEVKHG